MRSRHIPQQPLGSSGEPPLFVIDFEGSLRGGVVEYGVVRLAGGQIDGSWTALCAPRAPVSEQERAVHGLSEEELTGLPPFAAAFDAFVGWRRAGIFAAHNHVVEHNFLKAQWPVPPYVPDWLAGPGFQMADWGPWLDSLLVCRRLYPGLGGYGLGELIAGFHLQPALDALAAGHCPAGRRKPHCALYDALASALVIQQVMTNVAPGLASIRGLMQVCGGGGQQFELF
jgi:DNA polymerase III epsilon subunit-like protein